MFIGLSSALVKVAGVLGRLSSLLFVAVLLTDCVSHISVEAICSIISTFLVGSVGGSISFSVFQ